LDLKGRSKIAISSKQQENPQFIVIPMSFYNVYFFDVTCRDG